ncbi:MAG: helix-turn-helix transcriptional regulator [Clostridia bacterium]|nr:helix-turn-helix transcriptional regulator [Clostridia bacterium]
MKTHTLPVNYGHTTMGHGRCDYEGYYGITENMRYYGFHCHDFYECYIHLQGAKYYGIDNEVYLLKPNQMIVVPPFHMHGLITEEPLIYYERAYLYISENTLKLMGMQQVDLVGLLTENARNQRFLFSLSADQAQTCAGLMQSVQKNNERSSPWDRFSDFSHILPFLRIILDVMQTSAHVQPSVSIQPVMQKILIYINEHYTEPMTLKDISLRFGVSMSSLSHDFYRYIHHSVYDYILFRRVMYARQLMFENESLGDICYKCGFQNYSSFLRAFHNISGISPSEYRKQLAAQHI